MERYHLKKKYYRLKDGSFLNLQDNHAADSAADSTADVSGETAPDAEADAAQ